MFAKDPAREGAESMELCAASRQKALFAQSAYLARHLGRMSEQTLARTPAELQQLQQRRLH